jgi:NADH-ubiquinone oxidoreductase chain 6
MGKLSFVVRQIFIYFVLVRFQKDNNKILGFLSLFNSKEKTLYFFMSNIYILYEIYFGFSTGFLNLLALLALILGIFIIVTKNPIVSVLYLILLFSSISCYLIFIGIKFIGISYLLVYVGAVSILFLFILMLINIRVSELASDTNNNIPLAIITILAFFIPFSSILPDAKFVSSSFTFKLNDILQDLVNIKLVSYVTSKS